MRSIMFAAITMILASGVSGCCLTGCGQECDGTVPQTCGSGGECCRSGRCATVRRDRRSANCDCQACSRSRATCDGGCGGNCGGSSVARRGLLNDRNACRQCGQNCGGACGRSAGGRCNGSCGGNCGRAGSGGLLSGRTGGCGRCGQNCGGLCGGGFGACNGSCGGNCLACRGGLGGLGCGRNGCGLGGGLCHSCRHGHGHGHGPHDNPYGGVPHTAAVPHGAGGPAYPTYSYPYYTIRGPRDFFTNNPPSIGW